MSPSRECIGIDCDGVDARLIASSSGPARSPSPLHCWHSGCQSVSVVGAQALQAPRDEPCKVAADKPHSRSLVLVMMCTLAQHPDEARAAEAPATDHNPLQQQVAATERAFAKTMADRDLAAFGHFVSAEAVFVSDAKVLRGRQQVVNGWRKLYEGKQAPFSWEPQTVEVSDSQHLALSRGPVTTPPASSSAPSPRSGAWRRRTPGASSSIPAARRANAARSAASEVCHSVSRQCQFSCLWADARYEPCRCCLRRRRSDRGHRIPGRETPIPGGILNTLYYLTTCGIDLM